MQRQAYIAITPRLTLHGFSSAGCPLDAGVGTALTYVVPISNKAWLVASAGAYTQPSLQPGRSITKGDARVDLIFRSSPAFAWGVGLGVRGLKVTGAW
jgi:hypothetical protein